MSFVARNRPLRRYLLTAAAVVFVAAAAVAGTAVALRRHAGPLEYVLVGVGALYLASLMVTAASVGLAGLVAQTLDERPVTASTGWDVIRQRRRAIAGWALVDTAVGVPSRAVGSWTVDQLLTLLLGFGWSLITFFAIPTIAITGASALTTARHSLRLVRARWGDAVYSTVSLWLRALVVFGVPSAGGVAAGVLLIRAGAEFIGGVLFAAGVAGLALTYLLIQGGRTVVTVILYRFAESGIVYQAFPTELLERSVRGPSSVMSRVARRFDGHRIRRFRSRILDDIEHTEADRVRH